MDVYGGPVLDNYVAKTATVAEFVNSGWPAFETNPQRIGSNKSEFVVDAVITKDLTPEIDRETEQETGRYFLEAEIADYRGMLFPVRFVIENPGGIKYLDSLPRPSVLEIWGDVVTQLLLEFKKLKTLLVKLTFKKLIQQLVKTLSRVPQLKLVIWMNY